ncbi:DRTGG domain-containing protein [Garciella nitratireducens]|uniref:DRTGG domain-containing protein n=1 Tax=Garciella nitratireducens DSM 15102 TaxID=1121911 RepID=A0A1T4L0H3_9FIRM|nr:DRTGG domain-containing protein [Garciella nitratireducens]RBP36421.1 DRTGG domain-containing protein [Garciella nitratireducens]SJZ48101.1 DRTGG domain-containing protein [Garciella nitratireducens DSM 15102]
MKLREIVNLLDAKCILGRDQLDVEIHSACGSDLMSDVLSFAKEDVILLTGLNNAHVIRTADMAGIRFIIFVRGKEPTKEVLDLAKKSEIGILSTKLPLYEACGKLYLGGLGREN